MPRFPSHVWVAFHCCRLGSRTLELKAVKLQTASICRYLPRILCGHGIGPAKWNVSNRELPNRFYGCLLFPDFVCDWADNKLGRNNMGHSILQLENAVHI